MSGTDHMRASMTMQLNDQLSGPMQKIIALTKQFRDLAKSLGFGALDSADATLRLVGKDILGINQGLSATARQAEAAASAIRRMSSAELARARTQVAQAQQMVTIQRQAAAGAGLGQIYGPGGIPLMAGGRSFVQNAEGPSSAMGWRGRASNGFANARAGVAGFGAQIGLAGSAMAGISLEAPIHAAAELDQVLRQTAIMQNKSGAAAQAEIERLRSSLGAESLQTAQPLIDLADAYKGLINRGLPADVVDKLIPIHGRAATAYGVDSDSMGSAVYALNKSLGIGHEEMGAALAAMAQATHEGAFDMTSMSRYLPTIAGRMQMLGMTGRGNADKAFAALEIVSRNSADPAAAAVNFTDMMIALTQKYTQHAFKKNAGVDITKMFATASAQGIDPMQAYINTLEKLITGIKDPVQQALKLGAVLHNQQAGTAALSLLQHKEDYLKLRQELDGIGADKLDRDYKTAMEGLMPQLMLRAAAAKALEQRIGLGFSWTVPVAASLLGGVVVALGWMDSHLPGLANGTIGLTGGMLGLVAVLGVLGTVAGPVKAGFILLGGAIRGIFQTMLWLLRFSVANPLVAIAVAGAGAALYIWRNWASFRDNFTEMWAGIRQIASGDIWAGVVRVTDAVWGKTGIVAKLFDAFWSFLNSWTFGLGPMLLGALQPVLDAVTSAFQQSIAGWEKLFGDMKIPVPGGQADQRARTGAAPDGSGDWGLPGTEDVPQGPARAPGSNTLRAPSPAAPRAPDRSGSLRPHRVSYNGSGGHIHVTFTADVPGRATVRHGRAAAARGPMLERA